MDKALLTVLSVLLAATARADIDLDFNDVDLNRDATVDPSELKQAELFARRDLDGNGVIQADELGQSLLFSRWDVNDDRDLAPAEFYRGMFAYADADDDGELGPVEFHRTLTQWSFGEPVEGTGDIMP